MQLDYYGFWIEKNYYKYNKKYRVVEIDISGKIDYALQIKKLFGWRSICYYPKEAWAIEALDMINQRKQTKINRILKEE